MKELDIKLSQFLKPKKGYNLIKGLFSKREKIPEELDGVNLTQGPVSHLKFNKAWASYYDHKGSARIQTKRVEINQTSEQGITEEWVKKLEDHDVFQYHLSGNEIQRR